MLSNLPARWVLVLDGASTLATSTVAELLAVATSAAHLCAVSPNGDPKDEAWVEAESGSRLAADVVRHLDATGRVIVEMPRQSGGLSGNDQRAFVATLASQQKAQLLSVQLTTTAAAVGGHLVDDVATSVSIATDGLTAEQVITILNPVLSGPRHPDELAQHVARRLSILALRGLPVPDHSITKLITNHLEGDSADAGLLDRWWRSTVIDENTLQPVLEPETFAWIDQFDAPSADSGWPLSHAGLLHTYGYILSTAWTPFGWKSDRYMDGSLATLLGIDTDDLTPWAAEGTMLSNLTQALDDLMANSSPRHLIEESGRLVKLAGGSADGTLRTRIYEALNALGDQLLVYTVAFADTGVERYITAFPMGASGVQSLLTDTEVRSRFNIAATLVNGSRIVQTR